MIGVLSAALSGARAGLRLRVPRQPHQDARRDQGAPAACRSSGWCRRSSDKGTVEQLARAAAPPPGFSEAIRAIRTAVIFSSPTRARARCVVTSTAPDEGKTLVSSNLAVALAQAGQRTLVDRRRHAPPAHARSVRLRCRSRGCRTCWSATASLADAVRQTSDSEPLHVLPAGHIPPNPAELLGSQRYRRAAARSSAERFDWIIIDAPPVMAVTDAAVVAQPGQAASLFVVGAEMTPRTARRGGDRAAGERARRSSSAPCSIASNMQRHSYYYAPYYRKDYARVYARRRRRPARRRDTAR